MTDGTSSGGAAVAKKKITSAEDFIQAQGGAKAKTVAKPVAEEKAQANKFENIATNTFYAILSDPERTPQQKKEAATEVLAFADDKEAAKKATQEYAEFKEYMQFERKRMAKEIIGLTDTEAFSELKKVYGEINTALIEFEDQMKPLTDIIDAVYTLRMNDMTDSVFREIKADKEAEERAKEEAEKAQERFQALEEEIRSLQDTNAVLAEQKSFFGLGGVRKDAREKMALNNAELARKQTELADLTDTLEKVANGHNRETEFAEYAEEKAKLRELLDISSEEHHERQEALVKSAQTFIDTSEARVGSVLKHFGAMNERVEDLSTANFQMSQIYAILNDASKDAIEKSEKRRQELEENSKGVGDIERMESEQKRRDVERHISTLTQSNVDTTEVFADLTQAGHRIEAMREGNDQQIEKTRKMHTSGVAGVADQLNTVMQAVSAAALGEASEMAKDALVRMNAVTSKIGQKEVIRVAMGTNEINKDLKSALDGLSKYGSVVREATDISRKGLSSMHDLLGQLEDTAKSVGKDIREAASVASDAAAGKTAEGQKPVAGTTAPAATTPAARSPFGFGPK